jgi:hypothetical protein
MELTEEQQTILMVAINTMLQTMGAPTLDDMVKQHTAILDGIPEDRRNEFMAQAKKQAAASMAATMALATTEYKKAMESVTPDILNKRGEDSKD